MSIVTVLDDEYMGLWYDPETGVVHHQIKGYLVQGGFRKLLNASAELLEARRATKYLSDDRGNAVVDPEALVLPSTMVGTLQAKSILEKRRRQGLDVEGFDKVEDAMAWLQGR